MTQTQSSASEAPLFSIIVPTFKVEAFLRDCLDSVLEQSFQDYELLVVNDCSPDGCGEIIDDYAKADARVVPMHLEQNVGLGRARNAGMARAKGTYLLFLDSDDTMLPGSLAAIAARIEETSRPDLVVFDYSRTHWDGRIAPNSLAHVLAKAAQHGSFSLKEQPDLLMLLQVAWNKAYRRDFIEQWGFQYPTGYYEDTPWTYPVMIAAESISVLDRVCVYYRQRRQGSILHSTSRKHFDVFDQYDLVFAFLAENPQFDEWRGTMYERMVNHFRAVESSPGRLPDDSRAEFRERWQVADKAHRPQGQTEIKPKGALVPSKHRSKARKTVHALRKQKSLGARLKKKLRKRVLSAYYRAQRMLPVQKDVAVFSAYWGARYACNPAAIDEKMRELAPGMRAVWIIKDGADALPPKGTVTVHPGSLGFWKAMARGKYFVNNVNFAPNVVKRPGQVHLQTHHGTPLKRMGVDLAEYPVGRRGMNLQRLMDRVDRWDYSLTSNSFSTAIWDRAYPSYYEPLGYGYPRNDVLVNATAQDVATARRKVGLAEGTKAVLYTPTHRDYHEGPQQMLDLDRFAEALGEEWTVLVRAHYFYSQGSLLAGGTSGSARLVDVSAYPSVEELYLASDCLLTDYSSVMFDYANLDRPIVIYANDWDVYRTTRGSYFDITVDSPGLTLQTEEELTDAFASGRWNSEESDRARAEFRKRFCEFDDGHAAERVVRKVFLGQDNVPAVLPIGDRPVVPRPNEEPATPPRPRDRETV
ncbi:CDP-glycerol glycerophosphotransferase family protein [Streptomyces sp. NPDC085614]|uniref:bifunctional glycosyltransferase/CDP-glycerol:glycerophosphate glycerophosphotransferase n=1 Tax=Streptomyces sp. NPDC085614 TaxID=3365733 RepID=UPI0037D280C3